MNQIDAARQALRNMSLDKPAGLIEAIGVCGSLLGHWSVRDTPAATICRYLPKRARKAAYKSFDIPKKSGGVRRICAPEQELKHLQQALGLMLQAICEVSPHAMGFVAGRSVRTNAEVHLGQRVVFNCDLKDFFPSISRTMVRRALTRQLKRYNAPATVVDMICCLVTRPDAVGAETLPQGAPTSPVVSNIVMRRLDRRLAEFAAMHGYRYSRYADDITFSHSHPQPVMLPCRIEAIERIIEDEGLTVNRKKTRTLTAAKRREVTGLTVGAKVNVARAYVKQLRTLLHLWESRGLQQAQEIYTRDFRDGEEVDFVRVVHGKISYLAMIKGSNDPTSRRFRARFRLLTKGQATR